MKVFDERRMMALPGDHEATLEFAIEKWIAIAHEATEDHDFFAVALSGGSTPKKIFRGLCLEKDEVDWSKVFFFWSDERSVPPDHQDSNYHMAMEELSKLPIKREHIFRMVAESDLEKNALGYEKMIRERLGSHPFDLVMLGMGDDGHTASLFPHTEALHAKDRLVVANYIPQKETWRMTFTYECINAAHHICIYVMGAGKAGILETVLTSPLQPEKYPSQLVGTPSNPALWIIDEEASAQLVAHLKA